MRDKSQGAPFSGTVQMTVEGRSASGRVSTVVGDPITLTLDRYEQLSGQLPLPPNFRPRTVSIKVIDGAQRQQAMRIFYTR